MNIDFSLALIWFAAFLFSTTVHEAMHAFAAWKLGDPTAYNGGQVSLSPVPHVVREPIGMVVLPLVTSLMQGWAIGWASCPYDPVWAERYPKRAAIMAAAGPAGNLLVGLTAFILIKVGLLTGLLVAPEHVDFDSIVVLAGGSGPSFITSLLSVFVVMNVFLAAFNLLPVPPLDGAAVFTIALPERLALQLRSFYASSMTSLLGMLVAWRVFPMVTGPLFSAVLKLVYPDLEYS
jgi:Zn-dependent protease